MLRKACYKMRIGSHDKLIHKLFLSLLPIQALAVGLPAINTLLSSFIIGNYIGSEALAAIGFAGPLQFVLLAVNSTVAIGAQMLCGNCLGNGDRKGVTASFNAAMLLCLAFGVPITLLCALVPKPIALLIGASAESLADTAAYIRGISFGMTFSMLSACVLSFLQMDRAGTLSTVSVSVMLVLNIGINLLNVSVLDWGLFGAGLSTSVANIVSVLICLPYFAFRSKTFRFSFRSVDRHTVGRILYLGLPSAVPPMGFALRDMILNRVLFALGGTAAVSARTVALSISNCIGSTIEGGYSGSTNLMSSVLVGERDTDSLRRLSRSVIRPIFPIYFFAYAAVFAFAGPISLFLGAKPEDLALYITAVRVFNLWFLSNSFKTPTICIYRALGMVKTVSVLYMLNAFAFPVAFALATEGLLGVSSVFGTALASEVMLVMAYIVIYRIRTGHLPRSLFDMTYIPDFDIPEEDRFSASIQTVEEAVAVSEELVSFCKAKGVPTRTAYFCGLCLEEMTVDTITHGFTRGKPGQYSIDLRLICENGGVSIMLRDDSPNFDPTEWLELYAPEDPSRSIGIRMVSEIAREMNYVSTVGLNVLTIRL